MCYLILLGTATAGIQIKIITYCWFIVYYLCNKRIILHLEKITIIKLWLFCRFLILDKCFRADFFKLILVLGITEK